MEYKLFEEFITLQALLKDLGIIQSGGAIKSFLADHLVYFNGELENRRGKKIRVGDSIEIRDLKTQIILVQPNPEELEEFKQDKIEKERVAKLVKEMNKNLKKNTTSKKNNRKQTGIKQEKKAPVRFPGT